MAICVWKTLDLVKRYFSVWHKIHFDYYRCHVQKNIRFAKMDILYFTVAEWLYIYFYTLLKLLQIPTFLHLCYNWHAAIWPVCCGGINSFIPIGHFRGSRNIPRSARQPTIAVLLYLFVFGAIFCKLLIGNSYMVSLLFR